MTVDEALGVIEHDRRKRLDALARQQPVVYSERLSAGDVLAAEVTRLREVEAAFCQLSDVAGWHHGETQIALARAAHAEADLAALRQRHATAEAENARLRKAMGSVFVHCESMDHLKNDRHDSGQPCPVVARFRAALEGDHE